MGVTRTEQRFVLASKLEEYPKHKVCSLLLLLLIRPEENVQWAFQITFGREKERYFSAKYM